MEDSFDQTHIMAETWLQPFALASAKTTFRALKLAALRKSLRLLLLCACATACLGCETVSFYTQAMRGQLEISSKKRPVSELLADEKTPAALAQRLRLSQDVLAFASTELGLDGSGAYESYTDLDRDYVTKIVYAAPPLSLEPKQWWYPVVGKQRYQGYFDGADAEQLAADLREEGYETFVGNVTAYSTLGFFNDPILNTFADYPENHFIELLLHELTHHRYYKPRSTDYNEALAEVVAREATQQYLAARGKKEQLAKYRLSLQRRALIRTEAMATLEKLRALYDNDLSEAQKLAEKSRLLVALRKRVQALYDGWKQPANHLLSTPLNNARLVAFSTYEELIPALQKELAADGNDIDAFLTRIAK